MRRRLWLAVLALVVAPLAARAAEESLLLATTTSVQDTGLLDALLPVFTRQTGIQVRVVAVGSGAALRMGAQGDADVLLSHAPAGEEDLVKSGAVVSRTPIMENYFVLAGPSDDPAGVRDAGSPEEAFRRIAAAHAPYVSRGDDSGTNRRELEIFRAAGLDPNATWPGYLKTGSGMGLTLQVAGEKRAYVLSDIGTFLAFRERTNLAELSKPAPALRNVYSVLRVNPERFPAVHAEAARRFEAFLVDPTTQQKIAEFGREAHGRPLFQPLRLEKSPSSKTSAAP
jgi:tungstate transport system substrate-binding protein